jgi:ubiquinol-cytochrome c reductase cytochrome c1 subunit
MKKFASILIAATALVGVSSAAYAEAEKSAKPVTFSFEGPFGTFDKAQLQRGYKVYKEVCSNCHSMKLVAFRNLADKGGPGFTEAEVKALAASFKIHDLNDNGEAIDRDGLASDYFPSPFATTAAATAALGAAPPDLSLITKAREGWHGTFNQLVNGVGGPQYVYSILTGYDKAPDDLAKDAPAGKFYNPYFENGVWISMPPNGNLTDGAVKFDDGAPNKIDDMAKDVSAFLAWTAEPKMEERKQTGFEVLIYLLILAGLMYALKRKVWSDIH